MSTRALKRLQGDTRLSEIAGNFEDLEEESNYEGPHMSMKQSKRKGKKKNGGNGPVNPFELLEVAEVEDEDENVEEDESREAENESGAVKEEKRKPKKKKKSKKKGREKDDDTLNSVGPETSVDEVEASLQEVNRILGDIGVAEASEANSEPVKIDMKSLLYIDYRHLNPDNELKRMFGANVVRGEQPMRNRRQRNQNMKRTSRLVQAKDTWHSTGGSGLSMKYLGSEEGFAFEHSTAYQEAQHQFCNAVESMDLQSIVDILREHPYHIDSLVQMSDFHRMNEDFQTGAESIEKAIYGMECAFHPLFNIASGNCHLSYRRPENRAFYLCLFKHILHLGRRGLNRTAFEFCKLLLSLDPVEDPLDVMSMIDFYALRCEQYDYLIRLDREIMMSDMKQVPNFAFSIPLALYKTEIKEGSDTSQADARLKDSLMFFPMMLMPLLDQCSVAPDRRVSSHHFFSTAELNNDLSELRRLITMYVKRCESLWKEASVMRWLEKNVTAVLDIVDTGVSTTWKQYAEARKSRFTRPPLPLLRHYFLSEIEGINPPQRYATSVLSYDPFPPSNSIISYTRPPRPTVASSDRGGVLRSLLQSLIPTYNPNEPADERQRRMQLREQADQAVEGAVGGENEARAPIQQRVQALMQAMRHLLNEQMRDRVEPGAPQEEAGNEQEWEEDPSEWDDPAV